MSKGLTNLGESLLAAEHKEQYDESIKRILADRQIIAWILRGTTEEFKSMSIENIIPCIDTPYVSELPVTPGLTNKAITGLSTESKIIDENVVYYDVRFFADLPHTEDKKSFRIIVDLEGQKSPHPSYSIPTRGIVYGSRMISEQLGRNVTGRDYDSLDKVYSIWLVFNCNRKSANTIVSYSVKPTFIHGYYDEASRYDVLSVVTVNMPKEGDLEKADTMPSELHRMLYDIFVNKVSAAEKISIIKEKYNLVSETLERRINDMCNLSEALVEDTRKETIIIAKYFMQGKTSDEIEDLTGYPLSLIEEVQEQLQEE